MHEIDDAVDEPTLAAFLAGTLTESRRREVAAYLDNDPEAREVLRMASEALWAARGGTPARTSSITPTPARHQAHHWGHSARHAARDPAQRPSAPSAGPSARGAGRSGMLGAGLYASATSLVAGMGLVLWLALGPPIDAFHPAPLPDHSRLSVEVSYPGPTISWQPVADAFQYRLVVWDRRRADVAGSYRTAEHELEASHEVIEALREDIRTGRTYVLRVDAIDARNRRIQRTEAVAFVAE